MRKLKKFLVGALSVLTFGVVAVTSANLVKAASLTYGTDVVTTTSYSGDTRTWGFTTNLPGSNTSIAVGSDINGIINAKQGSSNTQINKSASNGFQTYVNTEILVPVPSADSTGTVTRTGNANNSRYLALGSNTAVVLASSMTFDFTKTDIEVNPTLSDDSVVSGYFLRFITTGGEAKTFSISVQLKDGTTTYGEAATLYTVTYMDGTSTLKTDAEAVEGSNITYTPKKYGYDFEGWYTESTLDNKITSTYTVTSDVTLYANWTAWTNTGIEEYTLSNAAIGKIATGIDGNLSADLALTPSIYTAMSGVSMTTTNVTLPGASSATQAPCFNTNGAVKTTGNGLKLTAPTNGVLTVWIGSGGGSNRNIRVTNGTNDLTPLTGALAIDYTNNGYTPHEVTFDLTKNQTYYIGGDNGVRIYYISFIETLPKAHYADVEIEAQQSTDGTAVRFITTLTGVDAIDVTSWNVTLTYNGGSEVTTASFTTLYLAVVNTKEAADGTYYLVFTVSEIPSEANGKVITAAMTVTFEDGSSITTLVKEETILQIA